MKVRVIGSEAEVSVLLAALAAAAGISVQKVSDSYPSRTRGQVRVYADVEVKEVLS